MSEYVIVGDTKRYKGCLIYVCGTSFEHAENVLKQVVNNPTEADKILTSEHTNIRIEEVEEADCWWNYGCD